MLSHRRTSIARALGLLALLLAPALHRAQAQTALKVTSAQQAAIDLNAASEAELKSLKGVGDVTAKKIIAGRSYTSVDELATKGIPQRTIEMIRPLVTVGGRPAPSVTPGGGSRPGAISGAMGAPAPVPGKVGTTTLAHPLGKSSGPIDINMADETTLQTLPGVGPAVAKQIVAGRPYASVEDLGKVKGIGAHKLGALRGLVTVGPSAPAAPPAAGAPASASPRLPTAPAPGTAPGTPLAPSAPMPAPKMGATPASEVRKLAPGQKVNINTASEAELDALPGIGPVKAKAIVAGRPYAKIEDVMKVSGIKEGVFGKIKDAITVQ